ncbi:hypothetical protein [Cellulosimicrobium sp. JZ28]|uniref:hypothetical protein n=1 Tax=Cellulosimicrobium sp. JZ28 TaxID=1906273 RepID=UPI00188CE795|nr:hypothetical protein [Cellulosimicrobium sp. JZ28]
MTLTRQNLDELPRGTIVRATDLRGLPVAAVKIGDHQTTGAHTWSITGPTIVESFQLAQRDAVLLTEAINTTTTPEAEALASVPVCARGGDESVELACAWSDFRKDYGVRGDADEYRAFVAGWQAARGTLDAGGPLR